MLFIALILFWGSFGFLKQLPTLKGHGKGSLDVFEVAKDEEIPLVILNEFKTTHSPSFQASFTWFSKWLPISKGQEK